MRSRKHRTAYFLFLIICYCNNKRALLKIWAILQRKRRAASFITEIRYTILKISLEFRSGFISNRNRDRVPFCNNETCLQCFDLFCFTFSSCANNKTKNHYTAGANLDSHSHKAAHLTIAYLNGEKITNVN